MISEHLFSFYLKDTERDREKDRDLAVTVSFSKYPWQPFWDKPKSGAWNSPWSPTCVAGTQVAGPPPANSQGESQQEARIVSESRTQTRHSEMGHRHPKAHLSCRARHLLQSRRFDKRCPKRMAVEAWCWLSQWRILTCVYYSYHSVSFKKIEKHFLKGNPFQNFI